MTHRPSREKGWTGERQTRRGQRLPPRDGGAHGRARLALLPMDTWVRPRPGAVGYRRDALMAFVIVVNAGLSSALYHRLNFYPEPAPLWLVVVAVLGFSLPLALRRRYPEAVAIAVAIAYFVAGQFSVPEALVCNIALFIAIYTLGAWGQNRHRANLVRGIIVVGMFVWIVVNLVVTVSDPEMMPEISRSGIFSELAAWTVIQIATNLLYFVGAWVFGNAMWESARQRALLEAQAAELREEREFSAAQAVALDRVRIARELHDVVAHHVSVMGVQAGAARRVVSTDPAQASASLEVIEQSARSAVSELHQLLTTLREDDADPASSSSSTRGVAQLPELVDSAGVPATLRVIGDERPLSALVGFTLYRVAQEALTNVRKHAGPTATVDVRLRYENEAVELEVTDTGNQRRLTRGGGLGQRGMQERIDAVGGSLVVGRRDRGGYLVRATIPTAGASA